MRTLIAYIRNRRGQTLVELALVLPVILLIFAGTLEFGRVFHEYLVVTAASREGARTAAVEADSAAAFNAAKLAASSINRGSLVVEIEYNTANGLRQRGQPVTVTVSNPVPIITPIVGKFFPGAAVTVSGMTVMRVE